MIGFQVTIFGNSPDSIDSAEDRYKFSRKLEGLKISQPNWKKSDNIEDAKVWKIDIIFFLNWMDFLKKFLKTIRFEIFQIFLALVEKLITICT